MCKFIKLFSLLLLLSACQTSLEQIKTSSNLNQLKIAKLFSDQMIIQRNLPIKIWGTAQPDSDITVELQRSGRSIVKKALTNQHGKWLVTLPAQKIGTPASLQISNSKKSVKSVKSVKSITIKDILFGEVWLASGQSNMHLDMSRTLNGKENAAKANNSNIRIYDMKIIYPAAKGGKYTIKQLKAINDDNYFTTNGWFKASPETIKNFSAVAYYFANKLQNDLDVPIGIIHNAVPGAPIEAWMSEQSLLKNESLAPLITTSWKDNEPNGVGKILIDISKNQVSLSKMADQKHPWMPGYLYKNGIKPIERFAIKGAIWYQGESNAEATLKYPILFKTMVDDWRAKWHQGDYPFYYVQLSSREQRAAWPSFRDSQRRILEQVTNTGMVVTSDIGDKQDTHAKQKKPVGERLALLALANDYQLLEPSSLSKNHRSPLFKNLSWQDGFVYVNFTGKNQGLNTSDRLAVRGFEIKLGHDFIATKAEIIGEQVRIKLPHKATAEIVVRYAWKPFSDANLVNSAGLPASTFTSAPIEQFYDTKTE